MSGSRSLRLLFVINGPGDMRHGSARSFAFVGRELVRLGHHVDFVYAEEFPKETIVPLDTLGAFDQSLRILRMIRGRIEAGERWDVVKMDGALALTYNLLRRSGPWGRGLPPTVSVGFGLAERYRAVEEQEIALGHYRPGYNWRNARIGWPVQAWAFTKSLKTSDHCICVSSEDRRFLIERRGVPPSRVTFIPVGVDDAFFHEPDYMAGGLRILFVGTWIWRKGVRYLRDAFLRVLERLPDATLSLVGTFRPPGEVLREFPAAARPRVRAIETAGPEEIVGEYRSHDVFVLPSLYEGMPLSLAEAMASGLPVVTTNVCGMRDLVADGRDGFLVAPRDARGLADAIVKLLKDPGLRQQLGTAGRERMRSQRWADVARDYLRVFETVAEGSGR